jgi:hypothetical protein
MRAFPADASYAAAAGSRFEIHAESMVRQAAGLDPALWEDALATLVERAGTGDWWLAGSGALAVRGLAVAPRDIDLIADAAACDRLAAALADLLVEPLTGGGCLGERWFRGFAGARFECVGGVHPTVDGEESPTSARTRVRAWRLSSGTGTPYGFRRSSSSSARASGAG